MQRNIIAAAILLAIGGSIWAFTSRFLSKDDGYFERKEVFLQQFIGDSLPEFSFFNTDSSLVRSLDLPADKPLVLLLFDPYCEHCKNLMGEILRHQEKLKQFYFCFLTPFPFYQMMKVNKDFQLKKYENIAIGVEGSNKLMAFYKLNAVPSVIVFDKQKKLKGGFQGEASYKNILSFTE